MNKVIVILICKILRFGGKIFKKGSSFPGKIALKLNPYILKFIQMPKYVIAVSGSNGKTSTVEMIKEVLERSGLSVACNSEGSNQIEGVTTFILSNCSLSGKVKKDVVLLETDERYARHTFKYFVPTHYIITNLYRDQLTRNGHPEWIFDIVKESINDDSLMILNCDDPLVNNFEVKKAVYFGIDENVNSTLNNKSVYNDGVFCPRCKHRMIYDYYHFSHIGKYHCTNCDYRQNEAKYHITEVNLQEGYLIIDNNHRVNLALRSMYNAYNILAVYALCKEINIDSKIIIDTLNNYILKNGRVVEFKIGNNIGTLLTSKHENSISYNQSLKVVANYEEDVCVMIIVDAISRKYFTSETSWLWDIDFELLNSKNIKQIVCSGLYVGDLALRIQYAGVDFAKVYVEKDIPTAINYLKEKAVGHIFVLTCFSDQHKLLNRVEIIK